MHEIRVNWRADQRNPLERVVGRSRRVVDGPMLDGCGPPSGSSRSGRADRRFLKQRGILMDRFARCIAGVVIGSLFVGSPVGAAADDRVATAETVAAWSQGVWDSATRCTGCDALELLGELPAVEAEETGALRASMDRYRRNIERRETDRSERIAEVRDELAEHLAEEDLLGGLRSALELHTLSEDKAAVIESESVQTLVERAGVRAKEMEAKGEWLDAHAMVNRLHLLHEEEGTYEDDLKRLSQRLLMMRFYTPERLHDMRSEQLVRAGEDPLPPYNGIGEDIHNKLIGVTQRATMHAIWNASTMHLDHEKVGLQDMILGGIDAVRTMATTADLSEAFEGLGDPDSVTAFIERLDKQEAKVLRKGKRAGQSDLLFSVREVVDAGRESADIPAEVVLREFGNGAIGKLDAFSAIIWPDELERFRRTTDGTFKGVGIQISLTDAYELRVVTPLSGTPAARAGIRPGDLIRQIDGGSTMGIELSQAVERITGEAGTKVDLGVEREGEEELLQFSLKREEIPIHSVKGWKRTGENEMDWDWYIDREQKIGYVRLTQFTRDTTKELTSAVDSMRKGDGLDGLILDLRYNPGGLLTEAVDVASLFIDSGTVVTQEDSNGATVETQHARRGNAVLDELPVVCLINGGSASASEIVAGCLQDYSKAVLVGDRSFGKGSVQNVYSLSRNMAFKLTTQYYRLPSGRKIHRSEGSREWGIRPDIEVEMLPSQIGDSLTVRQNADVFGFVPADDAEGMRGKGDPDLLIEEGVDSQLETALLLVQSQVVAEQMGERAIVQLGS